MPRKPPPTTGELLLRAVFEQPEDDAPRLAYADWLEESGGEAERAAFIRVQCELARLATGDPREADLTRAEAKLLRGRKLRWRAELPRLRGVVWGDFSRGFVDSVILKSTFRFPPRIADAIPLRAVTVKPAGEYPREMTRFGRMKALGRVSALTLACQQMNDTRLHQLLASPNLARVSVLDLAYNHIGDDGARGLAVCQALPRLKSLNLSGNKVADAGARALADSPLAQRLEHLDVTGNGLPTAAIEVLRAAFGDRVRV